MHTASSPSIARMKKIKFKSFSSGSCGNCYFLGVFSEEDACLGGILLDAGVSPRRLKKELAAEGLGFDDFSAILITHDHLDHIRSLGSYCKHVGKPVWTSGKLFNALSRHFMTGEYLGSFRNELSGGWTEVVPGLIRVHPFEVPHDATQTVGFAIYADGHLYVHITDCGRMTDEALEWCGKADTIVLESNYDPRMLENGPYPEELQERIRGGHGHMSNEECSEALRASMHDGLSNIFLCHLSEHNNTPRLALDCARKALPGFARIVPLPRQTPSPMFDLRNSQKIL